MFLKIFRNFIKCYLYTCINGHFSDLVLRSFQGYFTYFGLIINQRWAKTGVPGEKPPDVPLQNLASHMWPERGAKHGGERLND